MGAGVVVKKVDLPERRIDVEWGAEPVIRFDVVTLFPEMFAAVTHSGITRPGAGSGAVVAGDVESARFHDGQLPDGG